MSEDLNKKREWQGSYNGISVYTDSTFIKNSIELRDTNGNIIGIIVNVGKVVIGHKND